MDISKPIRKHMARYCCKTLLFYNTNHSTSFSKIYRLILKSDNTLSLPHAKWESNLSIVPDAYLWIQICKNIYHMTKKAKRQLIQYKVLHRFHLTRQKLFTMGFTLDTCSHCTQNNPDTHALALWYFTPITNFWENLHCYTVHCCLKWKMVSLIIDSF